MLAIGARRLAKLLGTETGHEEVRLGGRSLAIAREGNSSGFYPREIVGVQP
jgi:hypothetical protein